MLPSSLLVDLQDALIEVQTLVFGFDLSVFVEFRGECFENSLVLLNDWVKHGFGV